MSILVALALLGCCGCVPSQNAGDDSDRPPAEQATEQVEVDGSVLDLTALFENVSVAYDELSQAGLSWRDNGNRIFGVEAWPDAMVDSEGSHPIWDAIDQLGISQPDYGEDYLVGPAYVCLGSGLSPSPRDDLSPREVLGPDEVADGAVPDSVILCSPVSGRLSSGQIDAIVSSAGFPEEGGTSFVYDDTDDTGFFSEVRAGTLGSGDLFWFVQHFGNASFEGSCVLRMGILPQSAVRNLVETSALRDANQISAWFDTDDEREKATLFATAAAQEAIAEGGSWKSVVTGELMSWDESAGTWVADSAAR